VLTPYGITLAQLRPATALDHWQAVDGLEEALRLCLLVEWGGATAPQALPRYRLAHDLTPDAIAPPCAPRCAQALNLLTHTPFLGGHAAQAMATPGGALAEAEQALAPGPGHAWPAAGAEPARPRDGSGRTASASAACACRRTRASGASAPVRPSAPAKRTAGPAAPPGSCRRGRPRHAGCAQRRHGGHLVGQDEASPVVHRAHRLGAAALQAGVRNQRPGRGAALLPETGWGLAPPARGPEGVDERRLVVPQRRTRRISGRHGRIEFMISQGEEECCVT
jgi:hypothetical protein